MTIAVLLWLLCINGLTWLAFRSDKRRAVAGEWRIREAKLLTLALSGGWPAAKLAQRRFRHKTRKQPFALFLNLVPVSWVVMVWLFLMVPATVQALKATPDLLGQVLRSMIPARVRVEETAERQTDRRFFTKVGERRLLGSGH